MLGMWNGVQAVVPSRRWIWIFCGVAGLWGTALWATGRGGLWWAIAGLGLFVLGVFCVMVLAA